MIAFELRAALSSTFSSSLKDKVTVAEVDETRARVFLKEGRYVEAERVAFASVRALEQANDKRSWQKR